ncbi:SDR family NAD(P)-dependent oxidoreductase [Chryseobacterium oryctis]|uniref:SDR family NAD(P)-dependent oxidoreductase n=1 Tax=Chryseobacterium oryctis TaxID=2952618 RepID=A0ABT3HRU1_9FLAO|nr:SDR family NAD(P)-dependent oxidoreductase [Chryseobacterium oryctis]MCW3162502.1 SDR family NAD(P)-dependent oxidoreductase [Chryseobacterium oryctis]
MNKNVVITGAGSGLGRNMALEFVKRGYQVFGTATDDEQIKELQELSDGNVKLILCDLTKDEQILSFASKVNELSNGRVDVLVNNVGILTPGPLEIIKKNEIQKEFEVNTFSVLTVTNAFIPSLRATRGRIVQISTVSVDFPSPFNGLSAASKAATEALMTVYRAELAEFGIEVIIVAPGNMLTGGPAKTAAAIDKVRDSFTSEQAKNYEATFNKFAERMNSGQAQGLDADEAAKQIVDISEQNPAPIRVAVGEDAKGILKYIKESTLEEQAAKRLKTIQ